MIGLLTLTPFQICVPIDVNSILNTVTDSLRFVTEFFEVISQSACHIYHSALLLTPKSSIIWKLYSQHICSPVERILPGIPTSWDSCTAAAGTTTKLGCAVWSPCGNFIVAGLESGIEVRDSTTLERVSVLNHPGLCESFTPHSLAFSPGGHLLACSYISLQWWVFCLFYCFFHT